MSGRLVLSGLSVIKGLIELVVFTGSDFGRMDWDLRVVFAIEMNLFWAIFMVIVD